MYSIGYITFIAFIKNTTADVGSLGGGSFIVSYRRICNIHRLPQKYLTPGVSLKKTLGRFQNTDILLFPNFVLVY